jgi:hypothetical protein
MPWEPCRQLDISDERFNPLSLMAIVADGLDRPAASR